MSKRKAKHMNDASDTKHSRFDIERLGIDVWKQIFEHLNCFEKNKSILRVCKYFYNIAKATLDPRDCDNLALRTAIRLKDLDSVKTILRDKRINPSFNENMALKRALELNAPDIAEKLILDMRCKPEDVLDIVFSKIFKCNYLDLLKAIVEYREDLNLYKMDEYFKYSCQNGYIELIQYAIPLRYIGLCSIKAGLIEAVKNSRMEVIESFTKSQKNSSWILISVVNYAVTKGKTDIVLKLLPHCDNTGYEDTFIYALNRAINFNLPEVFVDAIVKRDNLSFISKVEGYNMAIKKGRTHIAQAIGPYIGKTSEEIKKDIELSFILRVNK